MVNPIPAAGRDVAGAYQPAAELVSHGEAAAAREAILNYATDRYKEQNPAASLVEFLHGSATYVFDAAGPAGSDRTVAVVGEPSPPRAKRDVVYQRGYPLPDQLAGRAVDRGHYMPFSGGGLFGPNLFVQDRALNRGWSAEGRAYRALETRSVASAGSVLAVRPVYVDESDVPGFLEIVVVESRKGQAELHARQFRNRYDPSLLVATDQVEVMLQGATDGQLGAFGMEVAAELLETRFSATILSMSGVGAPRHPDRGDRDLVVFLDGSVAAVRVEVRYNGRLAGRLTRRGRLVAPRLSGVRLPSDGGLPNLVVAVIDLKLMTAQLFDVSITRRGTVARTDPFACRASAEAAWHRSRHGRARLGMPIS